MRGKGINYDTGFCPGGVNSREHFDADIVRGEMRVIARQLRCTAVRISGGEPARLSIAGELAAGEGLEVWLAPFPCELTTDELAPLFAECADRAEHLRRSGANVVLVTGCELTLFGAGFLPGGTFYERIQRLESPGPRLYAAFAALPGKLNGFLAATAEAARSRFAGPLTYAAGMWEPVDWSPVRHRRHGRLPRREQRGHLPVRSCASSSSTASRLRSPSSAAAATRAPRTAAAWAGPSSMAAPTRRAWTATTCATKRSKSGTWKS